MSTEGLSLSNKGLKETMTSVDIIDCNQVVTTVNKPLSKEGHSVPAIQKLLAATGVDMGELVKDTALAALRNPQHPMAVGLLDASLVQYRQLAEVKKDEVTITACLDDKQRLKLTNNYPSLSLKFFDTTRSDHAFANASRACEEAILLKMLHYRGGCIDGKASHAQIKDVGGNWLRHLQQGRYDIHCCNPFSATARDSSRTSERLFEAQKRGLAIPGCMRCDKVAQRCGVVADGVMFLHSTYDMSPADIADSMAVSRARMGAGCFIYSSRMEYQKSGYLEDLDMSFDIFDDVSGNTRIRFSFNGGCLSYEHDFKNYEALIHSPVIFSSCRSYAYMVELRVNVSCVQFFSLIPISTSNTPEVLSRMYITPDVKDKTLLRSFVYSENGLRDSESSTAKVFNRKFNWWRHEAITLKDLQEVWLLVDTEYYRDVLRYASSCQEGTFTISSMYNYAISRQSTIVFNGTEVRRSHPMAPDAVQAFIVGVYIGAYVGRYELTTAVTILQKHIKEQREQRAAGPFSAMLTALGRCVQKPPRPSTKGKKAEYANWRHTVYPQAVAPAVTVTQLVQGRTALRLRSVFREYLQHDFFSDMRDVIGAVSDDTIAPEPEQPETPMDKLVVNRLREVTVPGDGNCGWHAFLVCSGLPYTVKQFKEILKENFLATEGDFSKELAILNTDAAHSSGWCTEHSLACMAVMFRMYLTIFPSPEEVLTVGSGAVGGWIKFERSHWTPYLPANSNYGVITGYDTLAASSTSSVDRFYRQMKDWDEPSRLPLSPRVAEIIDLLMAFRLWDVSAVVGSSNVVVGHRQHVVLEAVSKAMTFIDYKDAKTIATLLVMPKVEFKKGRLDLRRIGPMYLDAAMKLFRPCVPKLRRGSNVVFRLADVAHVGVCSFLEQISLYFRSVDFFTPRSRPGSKALVYVVCRRACDSLETFLELEQFKTAAVPACVEKHYAGLLEVDPNRVYLDDDYALKLDAEMTGIYNPRLVRRSYRLQDTVQAAASAFGRWVRGLGSAAGTVSGDLEDGGDRPEEAESEYGDASDTVAGPCEADAGSKPATGIGAAASAAAAAVRTAVGAAASVLGPAPARVADGSRRLPDGVVVGDISVANADVLVNSVSPVYAVDGVGGTHKAFLDAYPRFATWVALNADGFEKPPGDVRFYKDQSTVTVILNVVVPRKHRTSYTLEQAYGAVKNALYGLPYTRMAIPLLGAGNFGWGLRESYDAFRATKFDRCDLVLTRADALALFPKADLALEPNSTSAGAWPQEFHNLVDQALTGTSSRSSRRPCRRMKSRIDATLTNADMTGIIDHESPQTAEARERELRPNPALYDEHVIPCEGCGYVARRDAFVSVDDVGSYLCISCLPAPAGFEDWPRIPAAPEPEIFQDGVDWQDPDSQKCHLEVDGVGLALDSEEWKSGACYSDLDALALASDSRLLPAPCGAWEYPVDLGVESAEAADTALPWILEPPEPFQDAEGFPQPVPLVTSSGMTLSEAVVPETDPLGAIEVDFDSVSEAETFVSAAEPPKFEPFLRVYPDNDDNFNDNLKFKFDKAVTDPMPEDREIDRFASEAKACDEVGGVAGLWRKVKRSFRTDVVEGKRLPAPTTGRAYAADRLWLPEDHHLVDQALANPSFRLCEDDDAYEVEDDEPSGTVSIPPELKNLKGVKKLAAKKKSIKGWEEHAVVTTRVASRVIRREPVGVTPRPSGLGYRPTICPRPRPHLDISSYAVSKEERQAAVADATVIEASDFDARRAGSIAFDFKQRPGDSREVYMTNAIEEYRAILRSSVATLTAELKGFVSSLPTLKCGAIPRHTMSVGYKNYGVLENGKWLCKPNEEGSVTQDAMIGWDVNKSCLTHNVKEGLVVVNGDCEIFVADRVLEATNSISNVVQKVDIDFVQGVPGCGKTTYIVKHAKPCDLVLTSSRHAADELRRKACAKDVKTVDSYLMNSNVKAREVWIDEATMRHSGSIYLAIAKSGAAVVHTLGDVNQIPYVCFVPLLEPMLKFSAMVDKPTTYLNTSYRCPQDVAKAFSDRYEKLGGKFVSKSPVVNSFYAYSITGPGGVRAEADVCLTFSQAEKAELRRTFPQWRVLTIHEFEGSQERHVALVRLTKLDAQPLYKSRPHILVALTRHTQRLDYYTALADDAVTAIVGKPVIKAGWTTESRQCIGYAPSKYFTRPDTRSILAFGLSNPGINDRANYKLVSREVPDFYRAPLGPQCDVGILQAFVRDFTDLAGTYNTEHYERFVQSCDLDLPMADGRLRMFEKPRRDLSYGRLEPRLKTSCYRRRRPSFVETMLALAKRNLAVPQMMGQMSYVSLGPLMFDEFKKAYLVSDKPFPQLNASEYDLQGWLSGQPMGMAKQAAGDRPLLHTRFNEYDFSIKPTVKPNLTAAAGDVIPSLQTIAASSKQFNAIFCPMMRVVKERMLAALKSHVLIFTDERVVDFAERMTEVLPPSRAAGLPYLEIDISKYDKSQGRLALDFECMLLEHFGMPRLYVDVWRRAHDATVLRDRATGVKAHITYQRKSGDPFTLLGNTAFNMACAAVTFDMSQLDFGAFVGDDSLLIGQCVVDPPMYVYDLAFNLEVKFFTKFTTHLFCSKFLLAINDRWRFVPDPLKLAVKLGRRDVVDWDHLEEYRVSLMDLTTDYDDLAVQLALEYAVNDRYGGSRAVWRAMAEIRRFVLSPASFASLFEVPSKPLLNTVSKPILE